MNKQLSPQLLNLVSSNPHQLRAKIQQKLKNYDLKKEYTFDEVLFILDQECLSYKCNRDVARQLFEQSISPNGKASLSQMVFRYVENLQTSNLCYNRQREGQRIIQQKLGNLKGSKKTYVYLKIIQATVYARHSSTPVLTYKISPSDIPPVTVVNSLNPVLNHEFTLQLETNSFSIIFYESGVQIAQWIWPDSPESANQGEYHRNIMTQAISFELKINYKPAGSHPDRNLLEGRLGQTRQRMETQHVALNNLCEFQPFSIRSPSRPAYKIQADHGAAWHFVQKLFACLPFLRRHVRNLYYMLILLIAVQCWASIFWPMEFLDITMAFAVIGFLYDQTHYDIGMPMLVCILGFFVLIIKSIWGIVISSQDKFSPIVPLIAAIVLKFICIILTWIVFINKQEVPTERQYSFYHEVDPRTYAKDQQFFPGQEKFDIFK